VGQLPFGPWLRVSGVVDAEWEYLTGARKERATTDFLAAHIKPGITFVDVGSNVGYFTLLAASMGARVIAYEPTPAVYQRLMENVALNGFHDVTVVNAAVADKAGTLPLYQSSDDPEANNLFGEGKCLVEVPTVALDEDLAARGIPSVEVLMIDAEGAEPMVLKGAMKPMNSDKPPLILIEVNSHCLETAGSSAEVVMELLKAGGYRCVEIERFVYKGKPVLNIAALPQEHALKHGQADNDSTRGMS
jgi:FkbM family methyltransferase